MIKPDAVPTGGICAKCGTQIDAWYCVQLCDKCLNKRLEEKKKEDAKNISV